MTTRPSPPSRTPLYVAGVALTIAVVAPLLVFTYARRDPELWGIPFFFWYQFALVVLSVVLTSFAYRLVLGHERQRRAAEGLPTDRPRTDRRGGGR